jgi:hypothetical protein
MATPAYKSSNLPRRKRLLLIPPIIGLLTGQLRFLPEPSRKQRTVPGFFLRTSLHTSLPIEDIRAHLTVTPQNARDDLTPIFYLRYSDSNPLRAQQICQMLNYPEARATCPPYKRLSCLSTTTSAAMDHHATSRCGARCQ